jgi:type I restriction enzyme S subunit
MSLDDVLSDSPYRGVPFRTLGEVAQIASARVDASLLDTTTYVGVDNLLQDFGGRRNSDYVANSGGAVEFRPGDILIGNIRPYLKKVWLADRAGGASPDVIVFTLLPEWRERILPRYLFLLLAKDSFIDYMMRHAKGGKMPRGDRSAALRFRIPVPSLDVQFEIVQILDNFTKLEGELDAELEARKTQYAVYRDRFIETTAPTTRFVPLGTLATIVRGSSPRPIRSFLTTDESGIPWIKIGDVINDGKYVTTTSARVRPEGASRSRRIHPGDFILSNSMSFGRPYISQIEGCIHDGWLSISNFGESFLPDYLYHLLRSNLVQIEFARRAGAGTVQNLNADIVKAVVLPVPSFAEQHRTAEILDSFDALVNDNGIGIPAELNARRRQYKYYRDKLLTFMDASA